jgi:hypothetical protein
MKEKAEFDKFKNVMKRLVKVPLSEVKEMEKAEKRRPKRRSAYHAKAEKS